MANGTEHDPLYYEAAHYDREEACQPVQQTHAVYERANHEVWFVGERTACEVFARQVLWPVLTVEPLTDPLIIESLNTRGVKAG